LSPDEVSPLIQKEFQEFTEYPEKHLSQLLWEVVCWPS
jgi:hypothetical protein